MGLLVTRAQHWSRRLYVFQRTDARPDRRRVSGARPPRRAASSRPSRRPPSFAGPMPCCGHSDPRMPSVENVDVLCRNPSDTRHAAGESRWLERSAARGRAAQDRGVAERHSHQREFLDHRDRREGRHSAFQRRRRADAGLPGRRSREPDQSERHPRPAGSAGARAGAERGTGHDHHAGLRGAGLQGVARDRGHLRADLHLQGRQPVSGHRLDHGAARRLWRHHRLPADRHRQLGAQAGRIEAERSDGHRGEGQPGEDGLSVAFCRA